MNPKKGKLRIHCLPCNEIFLDERLAVEVFGEVDDWVVHVIIVVRMRRLTFLAIVYVSRNLLQDRLDQLVVLSDI